MKKKYTFKNISTKQSKIILLVAGLLFALFIYLALTDSVLAHGSHGHDITINNYSYPEGGSTDAAGTSSFTEIYRGIDSEEFDKAQAMSAAGDTCVFDYAPGWQGCIGGGWYGSQSALNGSLVTRVDNFAVRVNLQTDTDFDDQAIGVGGSWHF